MASNNNVKVTMEYEDVVNLIERTVDNTIVEVGHVYVLDIIQS
jgi:hypothetical protein